MDDILDLLNINFENEIEDETEMDEIIIDFLDNLSTVLEFKSEDKKKTMFSIFSSNMEYERDINNKKLAYYDFYDWNTICLYYKFAEYQVLGKEPDFTNTDVYFRKMNMLEFEDLKNDKHNIIQLPKESLDYLLDLINQNGYDYLTEKQRENLKQYSENKIK